MEFTDDPYSDYYLDDSELEEEEEEFEMCDYGLEFCIDPESKRFENCCSCEFMINPFWGTPFEKSHYHGVHNC